MSDEVHGGSDGRSLRFRVEVNLDVEPIRGRIIHESGTVQPFQGWLDLVQAIGNLTGPSGREDSDDGHG